MNSFFDMLGWGIVALILFGFFLGFSCRSSFENGGRNMQKLETYDTAVVSTPNPGR